MSQNTSGCIAWLANSKDSISKTLFRVRTHLICSDKTYFKGTIRGDQKCNRDLTGLWLRKCFWRKWVKSRAAPQQIWGGHFHQREPTSFSRTTHPQRPSDCSCGYSEWFEILSSAAVVVQMCLLNWNDTISSISCEEIASCHTCRWFPECKKCLGYVI